MNIEELKPCPFCGGEAGEMYIRDGLKMSCNDCGASVFAFNPDARNKVMSFWNTRAQEPTGDAVEALNEICIIEVLAEDHPCENGIWESCKKIREFLQPPAAGNAIPSESVDVETLKREIADHPDDIFLTPDDVIDHLHAQGLLSGKSEWNYDFSDLPLDTDVQILHKNNLVRNGYFSSGAEKWVSQDGDLTIIDVVAWMPLSAAPSTNKEETK